MDVRKTVTDAGYIAIGLGVMGYQQAQTRRRELTGKLDTVDRSRSSARGREVQGFLAEGTRQVGARGVAARGRAEEQVRIDRHPGARTSAPRSPSASSPSSAGADPARRPPRARRAGDRARRRTRPRAHRLRRVSALAPRPRSSTARSTLPGVLATLAGGVGAARFLNGLVRAVPPSEVVAIVNTGRRRRVPRAVRLPRPRLGHLHARRRVERRAGLGPRRRDVRHARRARPLRRPHVVPPRRQGHRDPPLPHAAAARGRDRSRR